MKILCVVSQVRARSRLHSAVSRSAPLTSSPLLPILTHHWMALILSSARRCEPIPPAPSAHPRAAGETWSSTLPCWASVTSWARGTAPKMDPRRLPSPSSPLSHATITAAITKHHGPEQGLGLQSTHDQPTCSVACLGTLILGLSKTIFRPVRLKGHGPSLITITCQCRSQMFQWYTDPVPQQPIRWVVFLFIIELFCLL